MPIDPNIAMSYKGIQLADPLAQYGRISAIQNAQAQNQLAQLQMQKAQQEQDVTNALNTAYQSAYDPTTGSVDFNRLRQTLATGGFGAQIPAIEKAQATLLKEKGLAQKTDLEVSALRMKQLRNLLPTVNSPEKYATWRAYAVGQLPGLEPLVPQQYDPAVIPQLMVEADKYLELIKPNTQVVNLGGEQKVIQTSGLGGEPTVVASFAQKPSPEAVIRQKIRVAEAGRQVTNMPPQEKSEQIERGKFLSKQFEEISKAANLASKQIPSIDINLSILDKGFETGFSTEAKTAGAKVLGALGVEDAKEYAANAEIFKSKATEAILQKQLEQKGPQTESDAQRISDVGAQLGKTAKANRFLLKVAKAQFERDREQRAFWANWWKENKTYDGAESAWYDGPGSKSLFDRPGLKEYASIGVTPAQIPPGRGPVAPAAAPPLAPIDQQALEWANANPADPRAAAIKQRLGR